VCGPKVYVDALLARMPDLAAVDALEQPRTLSVNPSLTIMALGARLADYVDADARGYLSGAAQTVAM
jgi:choline dehydrogenase-like flavoprotein